MGDQRWFIPFLEIERQAHINSSGRPVVYVWQAFPFLKHFITPFELSYRGSKSLQKWCLAHWWIPLAVVALYFSGMGFGQKAMASRAPYALRTPLLSVWYLVVSSVSFVAACRLVPQSVYMYSMLSLRWLVCGWRTVVDGDRDVGLWLALFPLLHLLRLAETALLVLTKRPVSFLHGWEHVAAGLYWYYATAHGVVLLPHVAMIYCMHTVMYGYCFLVSIDAVPRWLGLRTIRVAQVMQLVAGCYIAAVQAMWTYQDRCEQRGLAATVGVLAAYAPCLLLTAHATVKHHGEHPRISSRLRARCQQHAHHATQRPPATALARTR